MQPWCVPCAGSNFVHRCLSNIVDKLVDFLRGWKQERWWWGVGERAWPYIDGRQAASTLAGS